jgi:hypothetical protein
MALVLALVLGACSDDDADDRTAATATTTPGT